MLLLKLQRLGIKGLLYENIKSMYNSILYMVKVSGGYLSPIPSCVGLKQGGVLSPLLFNIYIDDIRYIFDNSCDPVNLLNEPLSHLLYADNLVLISTTYVGLNNCLTKLERFCNTWQFEVNIKKSQIVIFNPSGRLLSGYEFKYQKHPLKVVKSYCYLGVDLTTSGSFNMSRTNLMEKARKALFPLQSAISQFNIPCSKAIKLFQSYIKPIALYNSENLAQLTTHQIKSIEDNKTTLLEYLTQSITDKVQNRFLKFILGVKRNCSNMATLGEVGEVPLLFHGLIYMISYWHRTSLMHIDNLVKQALNFVHNDGPTHSAWLSTVNYLLKFLNLGNYFHNPNLISTEKFTLMCSNKLKQKLTEQWRNKISETSGKNGQANKLRFYKLFKNSLTFEPYLNHINDFKLRKIITKFRCSDHTLEIERGRHRKLKVEDRVCKLCNSDVETEKHFLQDCPCYTTIRRQYFGNMHPNYYLEVLKCNEKDSTFKVLNYLKKAFKLRDEVLALPHINVNTMYSLFCNCI